MSGRFVALAIAALSLAGCGSSPGERGVSGAGIGAAGGAVVGAVTSVSVLHGAILGAAVGGVTGALTGRDTIDLGEPLWKRGSGRGAAHASGPETADRALTRRIQAALAARGYDPGPADGLAGPQTRSAIREYQRDHGLQMDAAPSQALARHLETS